MFEQLDKLGDINMNLEQAMILMGFLGEYFSEAEGKPKLLALNYKAHSTLFHLMWKIIIEQCDALGNLSDELYFILKTIKSTAS